MSKSKKKLRNVPIAGRFTPILWEEQDSEAYKQLPGSAAKLYGYMVRTARIVALKLGAANQHDARFDFTYSEAKSLGFSESTTRRALEALWEKGFISVIRIGGRTASEERGRMPSEYQLCNYWKTYGVSWRDRTQQEPNPWAAPSEPSKKDTGKW